MDWKRTSLAALACALALPAADVAQSTEGHHRRLLAPESVCPGQTNRRQPVDSQEHTMRCMYRYARRKADRPLARKSWRLQFSAGKKADDILLCQEFRHTACGRDAFFWLRLNDLLLGCYGAAENLGLGAGYKGNVRYTMRGWLRSPDHRRALLKPAYDRYGVGLSKGRYIGYEHAQVWASHFYYHC